MANAVPVEPYGGQLVDLVVDEDRSSLLKKMARNLSDISLNDRQLCDLELLATGAFSPLDRFMSRPDYESVLDRMRLQDDTLWPLPVCLDVSEIQARSLETGQSVALRDQEGFLLAVMHIEDIWQLDRSKEADRVYGTSDRSHPGVRTLYRHTGDFYIGGSLEVISLPLHFEFKQLRMTPAEIRAVHKKLGWKRVVSFQTRHPIHRTQFEMTVKALRDAKANLLLLPVCGISRPTDFDYFTRVRCYRAVADHYPPDSLLLNLLPLAMRLSGLRDAVLNTIIAKNFGCTHFIQEADHCHPENGCGHSAPGSAGEHDSMQACAREIGMQVLSFPRMVYLPFEDEYRFIDDVPAGAQGIELSGEDIRQRILTGRRVPEWATFPEVVTELHKAYPAPAEQGFTLFLTGLSGAGKSTIAKVLYSRFMEIGERPVTLLDGDIVRRHLSRLLSFTKEHRDINVRRIGFVASEITKNRGIAICAPIAPYTETRREIRESIESYGGFIEIHVATPIDICEQRDRKGMYAKARAGLIKGFTGVDDPYEIPENPEVCIDTTQLTPDEATQEILLFLGQRGYI